MTASLPAQNDLFARADEPAISGMRPAHKRKPAPPAQRRSPAPLDDEAMARHLDESGRYRILRQLQPRPVVERPVIDKVGTDRAGRRLGIVLDTETTGLDPLKDEIVELGMLAFLYDESGIGDVVGVFDALREPSVPLSAEAARITGITPEMLKGQSIDRDVVARFVEPADLVIAHNAKFDRPFCERFSPAFAAKAWACSVAEVDWSALGFEGSKLGYLVGQSGWFHNGHRAIDDCHALLEVLATSRSPGGVAPFTELLSSSATRRCRIWAEAAPFHTKDLLKARGYRWSDGADGRRKCWWTEVTEDALEAELVFLSQSVYGGKATPPLEWLTAFERFKLSGKVPA